MPRAIWSGSISFGLVNVPVKAFTASRDHAVHFHQLEKGTGAPIRYEKVSDKSGKEVDADDIELGYELSSGRYVTVDPDELDELRPRTTRTIDVEDFVALDEIDPIYYTKTYWLAPDGDSATHAYRLLLEAMEQQRRVGAGQELHPGQGRGREEARFSVGQEVVRWRVEGRLEEGRGQEDVEAVGHEGRQEADAQARGPRGRVAERPATLVCEPGRVPRAAITVSRCGRPGVRPGMPSR